MAGRIIALALLVAAMLAGTKFYTDARFEASADALQADTDYCRTLGETGTTMSPSDQQRCSTIYSRDGDRNDTDEMIGMILLGLTALVGLIGILLIVKGRRRATANPDVS